MKERMKNRIYTGLLALAVVAVSCSTDIPEDPSVMEDTQDRMFVAQSPRLAAEGIDVNSDGLIIVDKFDENSILYFSQMGPTQNPEFINPSASTPYLYKYKYYENKNADWNTDYNFANVAGSEPFTWQAVREMGSYGNAFHFYGMYFPGDNQPKFGVRQDQRGPSGDPYNTQNFVLSDIMGAYHATSGLFTRMRFNLFHLMVYLKVKLYVPVLEYSQNAGGQSSYSGFEDEAVKGAYILDAYTDFNIEWRANRSSDVTAPLTQTAGGKKTIYMYTHERETGADPIEIDVRDYYTGTIIKDNELVREYEFSVLFPNQSFGDNFLCFALEAPDNQLKYYYFSGSQVVGDRSNYALSQGTLQELTLYLPRTTNQTILVQARVLPWNDAETDMTVTKQNPNQGN